MSEIEVAGHRYRVKRINAIQQFEIVRRLGPMVPVLMQVIREDAPKIGGARFVMGIASGVLSELKQPNSDFIVNACLGAVERESSATAVPLWSAVQVRGQIMFDDIDLSVMLELMDAVLQENLGGFFATLRGGSDAAPPQGGAASAS